MKANINNMIPLSSESKQKIFKDYTEKINNHLFLNPDIKASEINNLIILLNWCFNEKNNFFAENFNKKLVFSIYELYNQLKSNILNNDSQVDIFDKIDVPKLKTLKFILYNYISIYDKLSKNEKYFELCEAVNKQSIKKCLNFLNTYIVK